jgi:uncharacterized protein involved in exopolysaccharide biosynthesis
MDTEPNQFEDEIDIVDLFLILWRRKYFIIGGIAVITLVVLAVSMSRPKTYRVNLFLQPGILN